MKKAIIFMISLAILLPSTAAIALSGNQKNVIAGECETIRQTLQALQKTDSKTRVYLGSYYEKILSKFIIPLNARLVENSLTDITLAQVQLDFKETKDKFSSDFIIYQKTLEELVNSDCKNDPEGFYGKIVSVREKREQVFQDVMKINTLIIKHKESVKGIMETL